MACGKLFLDVSAETWVVMQREARNQLGLSAGTSGEWSYKVFTIAWDYDQSAGRLTIGCVNKPWMVPCALVNNRIVEFVEHARNIAI